VVAGSSPYRKEILEMQLLLREQCHCNVCVQALGG
jgi:hypothetical protein